MEYILWDMLTGVYRPRPEDFRHDPDFTARTWAVRLRLFWLLDTDERYGLGNIVSRIQQELEELIREIQVYVGE
jgi:hypothetical protein